MNEKIGRIESNSEQAIRESKEIRADIKDLRADVSALEQKIDNYFVSQMKYDNRIACMVLFLIGFVILSPVYWSLFN